MYFVIEYPINRNIFYPLNKSSSILDYSQDKNIIFNSILTCISNYILEFNKKKVEVKRIFLTTNTNSKYCLEYNRQASNWKIQKLDNKKNRYGKKSAWTPIGAFNNISCIFTDYNLKIINCIAYDNNFQELFAISIGKCKKCIL